MIKVITQYYAITIWKGHCTTTVLQCEATNNKKRTEIARNRENETKWGNQRGTMRMGPPLIQLHCTPHKSRPQCIMTPRIEPAVWWISDLMLMCGVLAAKTTRWACVSLSVCLWGHELSHQLSHGASLPMSQVRTGTAHLTRGFWG